MAQPSSFVSVKNVSVDYTLPRPFTQKLLGRPVVSHSVLRHVSFTLGQGDAVVVFGKEGAGKSTLLRLLAGVLQPSSGSITINGQPPAKIKDLAAGYISRDESEPRSETVYEVLHAFGVTHALTNLPARIGEIAEALSLSEVLYKLAGSLSTSQQLRVNIARAVLSDAPLIMLDDAADELGTDIVTELLATLFKGRTVVITTRHIATAENLKLPILILHDAQLVQSGTCDEIANNVACPRMLDVWIEGLRYDLLRKLRQHAGVMEVQLVPSSRFAGQKVRITLYSSRYLPSIYDLISQAPLVRVQELPASLRDIVARL